MDDRQPASPGSPGVQDMSNRLLAQMLGLDIPGIEPSTSYYPGYEWWPRSTQDTTGMLQPPPIPTSPQPCNGPLQFDPYTSLEDWLQVGNQGGGYQASAPPPNYNYDFSGVPSGF